MVSGMLKTRGFSRFLTFLAVPLVVAFLCGNAPLLTRYDAPPAEAAVEGEALSVQETLKIQSSAFRRGAAIPDLYTCEGSNISPPLAWEGVPEGARSLALVVDDPDAPMGVFIHWVLYNLPGDSRALEPGVMPTKTLKDGALQGMNDFHDPGYGGPCPPRGNGPHRYYFRLYALDVPLSLPPGVSRAVVDKMMKGHILGEAALMGRFERP